MSHYRRGDVLQDIRFRDAEETCQAESVTCEVGLATAAALYPLQPDTDCELTVCIPRTEPDDGPAPRSTAHIHESFGGDHRAKWRELDDEACRLRSPDEQYNYLFQAALRSLQLHTSVDVYPGPFTYKRFWFRDAAFLLHALTVAGHVERARALLQRFPARQTRLGYFRSQDGEWDSNGEAIWIMDRFRQLSGERLPQALIDSVDKAVHWIKTKRLDPGGQEMHAGLMPAGFSAEHLGPNDYYYWDDFWCVAGLQAAARIHDAAGPGQIAEKLRGEAKAMLMAIERSIQRTAPHRDRKGVPASPYRRMDSGAIGSLVAGYPLQLWGRRDARLLATAEFLLENCSVNGGFFQDMIHSGVNPYLTLHLAQVLLRAGDPRHLALMQAVADLASPTGQWPEAVHPRTGGGCMGDGQHVWASADWILMIRNCFVREEEDRLLLCSGIPPGWWKSSESILFGPTLTPFGPITVQVEPGEKKSVSWTAQWRGAAPKIVVPDGCRVNQAIPS